VFSRVFEHSYAEAKRLILMIVAWFSFSRAFEQSDNEDKPYSSVSQLFNPMTKTWSFLVFVRPADLP